MRHEFSQGWQVVGPWSSQREPQILWYVEGLALADQLSLNPFHGAHGYNTGHSDHWTWRAVEIPSGHRGPILTEPRLCHQSHSTSRIFRRDKSINSWLHNWSAATKKKNTMKEFFFSLQLQHSTLPVIQQGQWNNIKSGMKIRSKITGIELNWHQISTRHADCVVIGTFFEISWFILIFYRLIHFTIDIKQKKQKRKCLLFPSTDKQVKISNVPTCSFLSWHPIRYKSNYLSIQTTDPFSFWSRAAKSNNELESEQTLHL